MMPAVVRLSPRQNIINQTFAQFLLVGKTSKEIKVKKRYVSDQEKHLFPMLGFKRSLRIAFEWKGTEESRNFTLFQNFRLEKETCWPKNIGKFLDENFFPGLRLALRKNSIAIPCRLSDMLFKNISCRCHENDENNSKGFSKKIFRKNLKTFAIFQITNCCFFIDQVELVEYSISMHSKGLKIFTTCFLNRVFLNFACQFFDGKEVSFDSCKFSAWSVLTTVGFLNMAKVHRGKI